MVTDVIRRLITNKIAWLFASLHALLFVLALSERNGVVFHFYYEPLLLQVLLILDIFWVLLGDGLGIGKQLNQPLDILLFALFGGCLEWFLIGYGIAQLSNSKSR